MIFEGFSVGFRVKSGIRTSHCQILRESVLVYRRYGSSILDDDQNTCLFNVTVGRVYRL